MKNFASSLTKLANMEKPKNAYTNQSVKNTDKSLTTKHSEQTDVKRHCGRYMTFDENEENKMKIFGIRKNNVLPLTPCGYSGADIGISPNKREKNLRGNKDCIIMKSGMTPITQKSIRVKKCGVMGIDHFSKHNGVKSMGDLLAMDQAKHQIEKLDDELFNEVNDWKCTDNQSLFFDKFDCEDLADLAQNCNKQRKILKIMMDNLICFYEELKTYKAIKTTKITNKQK